MGIFLRDKLQKQGYKIQFERNTEDLGIKQKLEKSEIDLIVYNPTSRVKTAIEIRFPRNGACPKEMYFFVQDIYFLEELKKEGFENNLSVVVVDNHRFWEGNEKTGIYSYFRGDTPQELKENIKRPIEIKELKPHYDLSPNHYKVKWSELPKDDQCRYWIQPI